ncbi:winged helix-turn-helix domain-containing protein [Reyranella sp.]|uniref:winged helix-turn-helix domain-containing protein n=1 Tax=Reyranella sp. TaxID=1929291 RepID=UPI003BAC661A
MARQSTSLSASQARRIALAAQGFDVGRPARPPNAGPLKRTVDRLGLLQIDSVNVLARAHYLPLFSRLGAYDAGLLDRLAWGPRRQRSLFEFWAHEASLLPLSAQPLLRWRMQRARDAVAEIKGKLHTFRREKPQYVDRVLREIADRGPLAASDLSDGGEKRGAWWGWNDGKLAVEWLFFAGLVTTATRRGAFERVYDLTERVLPADILSLPTPPADEAQRELLRRSAQALGVATEFDLRDYFRLPVVDTKARLAELVEAGDLLPVTVEGWDRPAFLAPDARLPRRIEARALLAPFDPLIWERDRTHRIFDFFYRIEIYTPLAKRKHGYYVLPFLLGDRLVARVDLKADRANGKLLVHAAHLEPGQSAGTVAGPLRDELRLMADWLALEGVAWPRAGALAKAMAGMR